MQQPVRSWLYAHLAYLVLLLACFSPVWASGKLLAPLDILHSLYEPWRGDTKIPQVHNHFVSDAVTQYIPYRWFAHQSVREDGYVGWNNLNYCGTPQYANTMATSFDWTIQLHRWLEFWDAWHLGIFLQFWLAGAGMLVFLRSEGTSAPAAFLGAVCYAGNFQFIAWIYHRWALGSFCWMPLVLWAIVPLTRLDWNRSAFFREIPRRAFLAPLLLCMTFFGGTLQHAAFVVLAVGSVGMCGVLRGGLNLAGRLRCLAVFAAAGLLATGLAWVMFSPSIAAFQVNQSATSRAQGFGYPGGWLQPLFNLIVYPLYAFPWPMGSPATLDLWKFFKTDLFNVPYIGFVPAVLAVAGLFSRRVPMPAKALMAVGFLLPLTPLVAPLYHRVYLVGILGAAWSAAAFAGGAPGGEIRQPARWATGIFLAGSVVWVLAAVAVLLAFPFFSGRLAGVIRHSVPAVNFAVFPEWFLERGDRFLESFFPWSAAAWGPWLLGFCGCLVLLWMARAPESGRKLSLAAACLLASAELLVFAARWVTFSPSDTSPAATGAGSLYPAPDVLSSFADSARAEIRLYTDPSNPYRQAFPPNTLGTFGVATLRGYDSIQDKIMEGVGAPSPDSPLLPSLAVTHALVGAPLKEGRWRLLESRDGVFLYRMQDSLPRYLAEPHGTRVEVIRATQNDRALKVSPGVRSIRVAENWHEGWRYRIDGGPWKVPVRNADVSIGLSCDAPAGGTIELRFFPLDADGAWKASLASLVVLGLLFVARSKCSRREASFSAS